VHSAIHSANRLMALRPEQPNMNSSLPLKCQVLSAAAALQSTVSKQHCSFRTYNHMSSYSLHVPLQVTSMQHTWRSPRSHKWTSTFKAVFIVTVLARCADCSADGEMPHQLTSHLGKSSYALCFLTTACCRHCAPGVQRQHNQLCCCQCSELFQRLGEWH